MSHLSHLKKQVFNDSPLIIFPFIHITQIRERSLFQFSKYIRSFNWVQSIEIYYLWFLLYRPLKNSIELHLIQCVRLTLPSNYDLLNTLGGGSRIQEISTVIWGLNEITHIKLLDQCLIHCKCSKNITY